MSRSRDRVEAAAQAVGLQIALREMPASTRTAAEAAAACGCAVGQIVKSLVFATPAGELVLLLVGGDRRVDLGRAADAVGAPLQKADAREVREATGFAIGGVAPLGHARPLPVYLDPALLDHEVVWAAGGGPQTVFAVDPRALADRTGATVAPLT